MDISIVLNPVLSTAVFVSQSNLLNGAVYGKYANRLDIQNWAAEKMWTAKESILESDLPEVGSSQGKIEGENKIYDWVLQIEEEKSKSADLYLTNLRISWLEGGRPLHLERHGGLVKIRK